MAKLRDCPRCYGDNKRGTMHLVGNEKWICDDCGYYFTQTELKAGMIFWWCDGCGKYMNVQDGFTENDLEWTCTDCGFVNDVTDYNVQKNAVEKLIKKLKKTPNLDKLIDNAENVLREIFPDNDWDKIPSVVLMVKSYINKEYKKIPWRTFIALGIYVVNGLYNNELTKSAKRKAVELKWLLADLEEYVMWRNNQITG